MNFSGIRVLVLDGYGRQIPSVLQQLHELGCIITTVSCSKCDPGYASRYPSKKILSPKFAGGGEVMEKLIDAEICSGCYDAVIPILELSTEYIVKNSDKYSRYVKIAAAPTVKYFSQIRLCENEVLRCQAPLICPVAYPGGVVKGAASAAFIGVTDNGHGDP